MFKDMLENFFYSSIRAIFGSSLNLFGMWNSFLNVAFYLILVVSILGTVGNGLVLWFLGFRIRKGPLTVYLLHLALADFLYLACQVGFLVEELVRGSRNWLYTAITFLFFAEGLWLLLAFNVELCLSAFLPSCYKSCRPRHTSWLVCILIWGLTMPVVLLPAKACGLLNSYMNLKTCLPHHMAGVTTLSLMALSILVTSMMLSFLTNCCPQAELPRLRGVAQSFSFLFLFLGMPNLLCWALQRLLDYLLPIVSPITALLACIFCSLRPLIYFLMGRQPGSCLAPGAMLQRALGEEVPQRSINQRSINFGLPMKLLRRRT
ncbi:mas-related G-protein coupled receptor member G [Suncus etruscus]|uniref:mas-related G-protein coupled receptor member G n=1 Tax=Suncus etruscus TaxID=109475 RepID=UPI002110D295|nr:mas-related G-protein coupled receptor member G [Suncus etruscus]